MAQTFPELKKNALMQLFYKRQPQPLSQNKPVKKIKPNEKKQDDPLYKILSWRDEYQEYIHPKDETYKVVSENSITKGDQSKWGQNVQGVFVNIDWQNVSIEQLNELYFSDDLIHNGIIFIWGNKTNIGAMMDYFEKMNFFYVQNFIFVLLNKKKIPQRSQRKMIGNTSLLNFVKVSRNSTGDSDKKKTQDTIEKDYQIGKVQSATSIFCNEDSSYFKESQKVLYMFRKVSKNEPLQLRHQRTSDVYFTIGDCLKLDQKAKEEVYKMIETLLIDANFKDGQPLRLVQLWGEKSRPRKGWITVTQQNLQTTRCQNSFESEDKNTKQN